MTASAAGIPDPYAVPSAPSEDDPLSTIAEATIIAAHTMVNIGTVAAPVMAMADTYNGTIPGPTFTLNAGQSLVVRLINTMSHATAIHWHGVEMANHKDGSPFTQDAVPAGGLVPPSGTYLYKLRFPRPGLYWYHPHHHGSTNQLFRGLYGAIIVNDLADAGALPADTQDLVLSDITVCKMTNDTVNYPNPSGTLPWAGGATLPVQTGPTPATLCQNPTALDEHGAPGIVSTFGADEIPNVQPATVTVGTPPWNEGQTVLTNGVYVGGRGGSPTIPAALPDPGAYLRDVQAGQGLRMRIWNASTVRYIRLVLRTHDGTTLVPLFRVGGEGGLLDTPLLEGGTIGGFVTDYTQGEILLPPGSRAEVVAVIPATEPVGEVLTMWTQDYKRAGPLFGGWANIPTVPVMHLNVATASAGTPYSISIATPLRSSPIPLLPAPTSTQILLDPATFVPPKGVTAQANQNIQIMASGGMVTIDGVMGTHTVAVPYTSAPAMASSRYAKAGDVLELSVENTTGAHHPFHLHGFSMQPKTLTRPAQPTFTFANEFRDNIDIPAHYTLTFRIHLDPRNLVDDVTPGGEMGRWMFHCHIFFHAEMGMVSELVVTAPDGSEKPNVDVAGSWAYAPHLGTAHRHGSYAHRDALLPLNSLTASDAGNAITHNLIDHGNGQWDWDGTAPDGIYYVYITALDTEGRRDQTLFRVKFGGTDDGADNGDPHIHTVDGKRYDFQPAGEFTLLRDDEDGMEIQARQTPIRAASPVTDSHSGLQTCVSLNTAVAARVGRHRVSYQRSRDDKELELFVDGEQIDLPFRGLDLGEHRLTAQQVSDGAVSIRVDYANRTVLIVTPQFWTSYGVWYMNISVAHTQADRGIMGRIPPNTWLPALANGNTVGPMPASLHDRFVALYRTFADSWRVTAKTSLFVYARGTSTKTFTDREWPAEKPPCTLLPQFEVPGANPPQRGMDVKEAAQVCSRVTIDGLHQDCVFDVATTGDKQFAAGYELMQELRLRATAVQVLAHPPLCEQGEEVVVTATVSNLYRDAKEAPRGEVTFFVDGNQAGTEKLDIRSSASLVLRGLEPGEHAVRAEYAGGGERGPQSSSSPPLVVVVRSHIVKVQTLVHLQGIGDVLHADGEFAGTRGEARRLEGFQLMLDPPVPGLGMRYMAHLQTTGDTGWVKDGQFIGTRGQSLGLEGFAIELTGPAASAYDVSYFAHLQGIGDTLPVQNGQFCGTRGEARRVEGIWVSVKHH